MSDIRETAERLRKKRTVEKITTDEGAFYVRGLSGKERHNYIERYGESALPRLPRLLADQNLVAMALCDERGAALYESDDEAVAVVSDWAIEIVSIAASKVCEMSGLAATSASAAEKK